MEIQKGSVYSVEKKISQNYSPVSLNHEKTKETVVKYLSTKFVS